MKWRDLILSLEMCKAIDSFQRQELFNEKESQRTMHQGKPLKAQERPTKPYTQWREITQAAQSPGFVSFLQYSCCNGSHLEYLNII